MGELAERWRPYRSLGILGAGRLGEERARTVEIAGPKSFVASMTI